MIIQLGLFNYKCLFLLLFPIFHKIRNLIPHITKNKDPYYKSFNKLLSLCFFGFIYLIIKCMIKPEKKNQTIELQKSEQIGSINEVEHILELNDKNSIYAEIYKKLIEEDKEKKKFQKKNNIFFLFLISILHMIATLFKNIFKKDINPHLLNNLPILLESIFVIIFSMIFLEFSLYSHQYLSLAIISLCIIIFFIESIIFETGLTVINVFQSFIYIFFYEKAYCLSNVLGKKYLNTYMDNFYLFLFKIGIITTIPLLIYDIIAYCYELDDEYHGIIKTIFGLEYWVFPLTLLFYILSDIGLWLTIYYFSPCHFIILGTLEDFLELIFAFLQKDEQLYNINIKEQIITFYVLYPIIFIALLVFNEIIILNFCELNKNTKLYIMKRELTDDKKSYYSRYNSSNNIRNESDLTFNNIIY